MTDFLFTSADVFLGLLFVDRVVGRVGLIILFVSVRS